MREPDIALEFELQIEILQNSKVVRSAHAVSRADLRFCFELMTGIGWLDLWRYYVDLKETGERSLSVSERVCHSYEKWGDLQQEVLEVDVRMFRV